MRPNRVYLGDGLYAADDGYHFLLFCERENGENWVALDSGVMSAFFAYIERQRRVRITIEAKEGKADE